MIPLLAIALVAPPAAFAYAYSRKVKKFKKLINSHNIKVHRVQEIPSDPYIKCLELEPEFIKKNWDKRRMMSFGQYFSTLRIESDTDDDAAVQAFLQQEMTATLAGALMSMMGNTMGGALLPMILGGDSGVSSHISGAASKVAAWLSQGMVANNRLLQDGTGIHATPDDQEEDVAIFPLSITEIMNVMNINQTLFHGGELETPSLVMLERGEIDMWGNSFDGLISSPFDLEKEYHATIEKLEDQIREANPDYDPDSKAVAEPVPVNPRLFPDLYAGAGTAEMSHTEREGLECRLMSVLLNKLSFNYHKMAHDETDTFEVIYNGVTCTHPDELVEQLMKTGHTVDCCPRCQVTSFGVKFCVKDDEGWINIPVGIMLRSGFERYHDNRPVTFAAPHGGLDLYIRGPLVGSKNSCAMQFYVAYKGLCAFHADQDIAGMPWIKKSSLAEPYDSKRTIRAVRMAGLVSVACNTISTEMNLPFGGYGILGVCNDLSGVIDFSVNDKTSAYPLTSSGRYIGHFIRCLMELEKKMEKAGGMETPVRDVKKLIHGFATIDNDLQAAPAKAFDTKDRYKVTHNEFFFTENARSMEVMNEIANNYKVITEWHGENELGGGETKTASSSNKKWGRKK